MEITGKTIEFSYAGHAFTLCNQRSRDWTCPYAFEGNGSTLSNAGCGIFSIVHASRWLTGVFHDPEQLARFSLTHGGRYDGGTDRPALLQAMVDCGEAERFGFTYYGDGLRNDMPALYEHLRAGHVALCNLREGHIVTLLAAREQDGIQQVLAADSYCESADSRIADHVREVIPGSEIIFETRNAQGLTTGWMKSYSLFWADLSIVRDFNLLYRL